MHSTPSRARHSSSILAPFINVDIRSASFHKKRPSAGGVFPAMSFGLGVPPPPIGRQAPQHLSRAIHNWGHTSRFIPKKKAGGGVVPPADGLGLSSLGPSS